MTEDLKALTGRLAADPDSLAFLPLGEALRQRGQLDAALAVALRGVERYPALAEAHHLLGRVRSDRGEGDLAFDAWTEALRLDPGHVGALRGLAFLAFRAGDLDRAERQLERALALAPTDAAVRSALARVRDRRRRPSEVPVPIPPQVDAPGTLLLDAQGRRLAGTLQHPDGTDVSDVVAAELAGVSREAARSARLLDLGDWRALMVECTGVRLQLLPPTEESLLLVCVDPDLPAGRAALLTERTAIAARRWLERIA